MQEIIYYIEITWSANIQQAASATGDVIWLTRLTGLSMAAFATRFTKGPWENAANAVIAPCCIE